MPRLLVRRHFFLVAAVGLVLLMAVAGGLKLAFGGSGKNEGGGAPAAAMGGGKKDGGGGPGGRASQVSAAVTTVRSFTDRIDVIGVAKARKSVTLTSDATELITRIQFTSGQYVRQGAVLATLKSDEQKAEVANARAALERARKDNERWAELARRGFAPRAQVDQYQAAYNQAAAGLEAAEARLRDRVIRAPFSGTVGLSDAAPGMLITPGTPIATLDDLSLILVDFDIPERFLGIVGIGTSIQARADAYAEQTFVGRIAKVDTRVKPDTRSVTARAEFANQGVRIKPGMLLKVSIDQGQRTSVAAPESAVQFEGDQPFVFAVVRQGERTVAVQKAVVTGAREGGFVEILEGLKAGDQIVADGLNRIQPNQPIRVGGVGGRGGGGPGKAARRPTAP